MERMTMKTALDNLMRNYGDFGLSRKDFKEVLEMGIKGGMTVHGAYIAAKMIITEQTGEHELFTSEDIAEITGLTVEEVNKQIEDTAEVMQALGINPNNYFGEYEPIRILTKL